MRRFIICPTEWEAYSELFFDRQEYMKLRFHNEAEIFRPKGDVITLNAIEEYLDGEQV